MSFQFESGYTLLRSIAEADARTGGIPGNGGYDSFNLTVSHSGDTAGGYMRFRNQEANWGQMSHVWWQPIPQFKLKLGRNDGDFGAAKITGWGWTQGAKLGGSEQGAAWDTRIGGIGYNWDHNPGFAPGTGWNNWRMNFSFYLVDGLEINWAIRNMNQDMLLENIINKFYFNVKYALDFGEINVSADIKDGKTIAADPASGSFWESGIGNGTQTSTFYASFYLAAIDNIGLDIGLAYKLPGEVTDAGNTYKITNPINIGLGFTFNATDDFLIKARAGARLGSAVEVGGVSSKGPTVISFEILPSYKVADTVTIFFQAGLQTMVPDTGDSWTMFFINPYVSISPGEGVNLHIGFKYTGYSTTPATKSDWVLPITFSMNM